MYGYVFFYYFQVRNKNGTTEKTEVTFSLSSKKFTSKVTNRWLNKSYQANNWSAKKILLVRIQL